MQSLRIPHLLHYPDLLLLQLFAPLPMLYENQFYLNPFHALPILLHPASPLVRRASRILIDALLLIVSLPNCPASVLSLRKGSLFATFAVGRVILHSVVGTPLCASSVTRWVIDQVLVLLLNL